MAVVVVVVVAAAAVFCLAAGAPTSQQVVVADQPLPFLPAQADEEDVAPSPTPSPSAAADPGGKVDRLGVAADGSNVEGMPELDPLASAKLRAETQMQRLYLYARAESLGRTPDGRSLDRVASFIDHMGYGDINPGQWALKVPSELFSAEQLAHWLNNERTFVSLGLRRLDLDDPRAAPRGALIIVRAATPTIPHRTQGEVAVSGGHGVFFDGGTFEFRGREVFKPGNDYVLGVYVPEPHRTERPFCNCDELEDCLTDSNGDRRCFLRAGCGELMACLDTIGGLRCFSRYCPNMIGPRDRPQSGVAFKEPTKLHDDRDDEDDWYADRPVAVEPPAERLVHEGNTSNLTDTAAKEAVLLTGQPTLPTNPTPRHRASPSPSLFQEVPSEGILSRGIDSEGHLNVDAAAEDAALRRSLREERDREG